MKSTIISTLFVTAKPGNRHIGVLRAGPLTLTCALGRAGIVRRKREGDGGTPAARMRMLGGFYRADRISRRAGALPLVAIRPRDGWCDDPRSPTYNRPVRLPDRFGHEVMWRDDHVYDVVIDLSWNRGPIARGRGSAIFMHLARSGYTPTEGCIALAGADMRRLLPRLSRRTTVVVG